MFVAVAVEVEVAAFASVVDFDKPLVETADPIRPYASFARSYCC